MRLSCKVDGVEFFGIRNPFVHRLLRELVANVNGVAITNGALPLITANERCPRSAEQTSLNGIPLLVLGNKIDKPGALSGHALVEEMGRSFTASV